MPARHARICWIAAALTLLAVMGATCPLAQESQGGISPAARTYLEQALNLMQQNALNKSSIDWTHVCEQALARANHANTSADTYPSKSRASNRMTNAALYKNASRNTGTPPPS